MTLTLRVPTWFGSAYIRFFIAFFVFVFAASCLSAQDQTTAAKAPAAVVLTKAALRIHDSAYVFDGHNDLPWALRSRGTPSFVEFDIAEPKNELHTDIPRLRQGRVGAQFWSVYVPASTKDKGTALRSTLEQIQLVHDMIEHYPDVFELATSSDDVIRIQQSGKIASLIGVEGGHAIENSINALRQLYLLGARYMTLTHSDTLDWADSATDEARHQGLSRFGEEVVREMNRLGMLVDLSHVSIDTMKDALSISRAPVIFSHSSARAVADHPRNVPDEVLRATAENHGVVMVNFFSGFIVPESARVIQERSAVRARARAEHANDDSEQRRAIKRWDVLNPLEPGTIHDVLDHIDHIAQVAGIDHVGLGSDFDGVTMLPAQLGDVSKFPYITQGLLDRGYTEPAIRKILFGNILRVLHDAERVAGAHPER